MADISFYMLFNENLLNEEKLARMLQEMERRISRQQEAIDRRKREYQEYFTRQEQVKHQRVNKERFQAAISRLKELKGEQEGLEERLKEARKEAETLKQTLKALDQELRQLKEQAELGGRRLEDFKRLIKAYGQYRESRTELESCRRRMGKLAEKKAWHWLARSGLRSGCGRWKARRTAWNRSGKSFLKSRRFTENTRIWRRLP